MVKTTVGIRWSSIDQWHFQALPISAPMPAKLRAACILIKCSRGSLQRQNRSYRSAAVLLRLCYQSCRMYIGQRKDADPEQLAQVYNLGDLVTHLGMEEEYSKGSFGRIRAFVHHTEFTEGEIQPTSNLHFVVAIIHANERDT